MKKPDRLSHESHLAIREFFVPPGGEWLPKLSGWSLIQIRYGNGYWMEAQSSRELEAGTVLLVADQVQGSFRASQLGGLSLYSFSVLPARLTGLITFGEQGIFARAASRKECSLQIFSSSHPVALKMKELYENRNSPGLLFRLNLLQLFVDVFGNELKQAVSTGETSDARERLRLVLSETPPDEFLEMSFNEMAQVTHCTPRHLGRIFNELVGMSFRDKRAEIRLARARELLATSNSKVVEVALECGYKSLSLFNLMFTRRFGTSPGRWRRKQAGNGGTESNLGRRRNSLRPAENSGPGFRINQTETPAGRPKSGELVRVKQEVAQRLQAAFAAGTDNPSFNPRACSPTVP